MPGRIDEARERETQEVVGKLKDVSLNPYLVKQGVVANMGGFGDSSGMDC